MRTLTTLTLIAAALLATGCTYSRNATNTARNATEQLLLTTSIERAVDAVDLPDVTGKAVAVDTSSLAAEAEVAYIKNALTSRLRREGAAIAEADAADIVLTAHIGTSGSAARQIFLGLKGFTLGVAGGFPSLALFDFDRQYGYTEVSLTAHDGSGAFLGESAPVIERTYFNVYGFLLLFAVRTNDIYPDEGFEIGLY